MIIILNEQNHENDVHKIKLSYLLHISMASEFTTYRVYLSINSMSGNAKLLLSISIYLLNIIEIHKSIETNITHNNIKCLCLFDDLYLKLYRVFLQCLDDYVITVNKVVFIFHFPASEYSMPTIVS